MLCRSWHSFPSTVGRLIGGFGATSVARLEYILTKMQDFIIAILVQALGPSVRDGARVIIHWFRNRDVFALLFVAVGVLALDSAFSTKVQALTIALVAGLLLLLFWALLVARSWRDASDLRETQAAASRRLVAPPTT